jgi:hypothetical protein
VNYLLDKLHRSVTQSPLLPQQGNLAQPTEPLFPRSKSTTRRCSRTQPATRHVPVPSAVFTNAATRRCHRLRACRLEHTGAGCMPRVQRSGRCGNAAGTEPSLEPKPHDRAVWHVLREVEASCAVPHAPCENVSSSMLVRGGACVADYASVQLTLRQTISSPVR